MLVECVGDILGVYTKHYLSMIKHSTWYGSDRGVSRGG